MKMSPLLESFVRAFSRAHMAFYRTFGAYGPLAKDMLILTTRGRRTGRERSTPLLYAEESGRLYLVASFGGNDQPPGWFRNLQASPEVEVEIRGARARYRGRTLDAEEARPIWPKLLAIYPTYATYQKKTTRLIPVIELSPLP